MMPSPPSPLTGPICTIPTLTTDLTALGIRPGDTLLVHSSLSSLGYVCGRSEAVVRAFLNTIGPTGTLVVPTQTESNSDPSEWKRPPVPEAWWPIIRAETPAFNPATTPSVGMGAVAETVRTWPGALRSAHPQISFAAVGPRAGELMEGHAVDCRLGERSPLAKLEKTGARVVLLGVSWNRCTAFHLAEYRVKPTRETFESSFAVDAGKGREWMTVREPDFADEKFPEIGRDFEKSGRVVIGKVGHAETRVFDLADAVAFAEEWFNSH